MKLLFAQFLVVSIIAAIAILYIMKKPMNYLNVGGATILIFVGIMAIYSTPMGANLFTPVTYRENFFASTVFTDTKLPTSLFKIQLKDKNFFLTVTLSNPNDPSSARLVLAPQLPEKDSYWYSDSNGFLKHASTNLILGRTTGTNPTPILLDQTATADTSASSPYAPINFKWNYTGEVTGGANYRLNANFSSLVAVENPAGSTFKYSVNMSNSNVDSDLAKWSFILTENYDVIKNVTAAAPIRHSTDNYYILNNFSFYGWFTITDENYPAEIPVITFEKRNTPIVPFRVRLMRDSTGKKYTMRITMSFREKGTVDYDVPDYTFNPSTHTTSTTEDSRDYYFLYMSVASNGTSSDGVRIMINGNYVKYNENNIIPLSVISNITVSDKRPVINTSATDIILNNSANIVYYPTSGWKFHSYLPNSADDDVAIKKYMNDTRPRVLTCNFINVPNKLNILLDSAFDFNWNIHESFNNVKFNTSCPPPNYQGKVLELSHTVADAWMLGFGTSSLSGSPIAPNINGIVPGKVYVVSVWAKTTNPNGWSIRPFTGAFRELASADAGSYSSSAIMQMHFSDRWWGNPQVVSGGPGNTTWQKKEWYFYNDPIYGNQVEKRLNFFFRAGVEGSEPLDTRFKYYLYSPQVMMVLNEDAIEGSIQTTKYVMNNSDIDLSAYMDDRVKSSLQTNTPVDRTVAGVNAPVGLAFNLPPSSNDNPLLVTADLGDNYRVQTIHVRGRGDRPGHFSKIRIDYQNPYTKEYVPLSYKGKEIIDANDDDTAVSLISPISILTSSFKIYGVEYDSYPGLRISFSGFKEPLDPCEEANANKDNMKLPIDERNKYLTMWETKCAKVPKVDFTKSISEERKKYMELASKLNTIDNEKNRFENMYQEQVEKARDLEINYSRKLAEVQNMKCPEVPKCLPSTIIPDPKRFVDIINIPKCGQLLKDSVSNEAICKVGPSDTNITKCINRFA